MRAATIPSRQAQRTALIIEAIHAAQRKGRTNACLANRHRLCPGGICLCECHDAACLTDSTGGPA